MRAVELDRRSRKLISNANHLLYIAIIESKLHPRDRRHKRLRREADKLVQDSFAVRNEVRSALEETFLECVV